MSGWRGIPVGSIVRPNDLWVTEVGGTSYRRMTGIDCQIIRSTMTVTGRVYDLLPLPLGEQGWRELTARSRHLTVLHRPLHDIIRDAQAALRSTDANEARAARLRGFADEIDSLPPMTEA